MSKHDVINTAQPRLLYVIKEWNPTKNPCFETWAIFFTPSVFFGRDCKAVDPSITCLL